MATEITEFTASPMRYGGLVPVFQLPPLRHTSLAVGAALTVGAGTSLLMVTPGEDVRIDVTGDGSVPAPSGSSMLLKAGVRYDFKAHPGMQLKGV